MQKQIEQYLNRATRGLWGQKRQHIKQELYSHIYEKMHFQMAFGKSEQEALQAALDSMGTPKEVNAGLVKVHALPTLGKMFLITGLLSTAIISQAQRQHPINVFTEHTQCRKINHGTEACTDNPIYFISFQELTRVLQEQKVPFKLENQQKGPESAAILTIGNQTTTIPYQNDHDRTSIIKEQNGQTLISIYLLLMGLLDTENTRLHGLVNPTIDIGGTSFKLGTREHGFSADTAYVGMLNNYMQKHHKLGLASPADSFLYSPSTFTIRVPEARDGEVYALVQGNRDGYYACPCDSSMEGQIQMASATLAEARNGKIMIQSRYAEIKPGSLQDPDQGDVLLKLSGEFKKHPFTVVQVKPEDILP